jgi:outer membrane protein TolC
VRAAAYFRRISRSQDKDAARYRPALSRRYPAAKAAGTFDLINSQTTAIAAETRAIETRRARIENRINLHLALGNEPLSA